MSGRMHRRLRRSAWLVPLLAVPALLVPFLAGSSSAATAGTLYSYRFAGVTTAQIPNSAAAYTAVPLKLYGSWTSLPDAVHFTGDRVSKQSVGYAKPASGSTLNVAGSSAFGVGIRFRYTAPATGACFPDSVNLTQIGRFGAGLAQVKLQLSNCKTSSTATYPECRMAGSKSTTADLPRRGSQPLMAGATYVLWCFKGPDPASGQATLNLHTTRVDQTATTTKNQFAITAPGALTSSAYLSVANKYALPSVSNNTDQFNGDVLRLAYCRTSTVAGLTTCLNTEVPAL